jgi:hypothetical protein
LASHPLRKTGYKEGTRFCVALSDGWSRGFQNSQIIQELSEIGFIVDDAFVDMFRNNMDKEMDNFFLRNQ